MSTLALVSLIALAAWVAIVGTLTALDRLTQPRRDLTTETYYQHTGHATDCARCWPYDQHAAEGIEQAEQWANGGAA